MAENDKKCCLIYSTFSDFDSAKKIAEDLLSKKLVACCNISGPVKSLYNWGGDICEDNEYKLLIKAKDTNYQKIEEHILEKHPYDNPCIFSINMDKGSENFLNWIDSSSI
jgi:periplasmic divalent cation tolerance protein